MHILAGTGCVWETLTTSIWVILASSSVTLSPQTLLSMQLIWSPHTAAPMLPAATMEGGYIAKLWSEKRVIREHETEHARQANLPPANRQSSLQTNNQANNLQSERCERAGEGETAWGDLNVLQRFSHLLWIRLRTSTWLAHLCIMPFSSKMQLWLEKQKVEPSSFLLHPRTYLKGFLSVICSALHTDRRKPPKKLNSNAIYMTILNLNSVKSGIELQISVSFLRGCGGCDRQAWINTQRVSQLCRGLRLMPWELHIQTRK